MADPTSAMDTMTDEQMRELEAEGQAITLPDEMPPDMPANMDLEAPPDMNPPTEPQAPLEPPPPRFEKPPKSLTEEEMAQTGAVTIDSQLQEEAPVALTDQQMEEHEYMLQLTGQRVQEFAASLPPGELGFAEAAKTWQATKKHWDRKTGWFDRAMYALTIPEQFVARQAVNVLENNHTFTTEEAKDLIARDQVHGSDIVHVWWKNKFGRPDTWGEKAVKFTAGLAADIILDPLTYINPFALATRGAIAMGKQVTGTGLKIAGREVTGQAMRQMANADRYYVKTLQQLEKVVTSHGSVEAMDGAADVAEKNRAIIGTAVDSITNPNGRLSFDELLKPMTLTPEAAKEAQAIVRKGMTKKSLAQELVEGDRVPSIGIGIPFTRFGVEATVPFMSEGAGKAIGHSLGLIEKLAGGALNLAKTPFGMFGYKNVNPIGPMIRVVQDLASRTGALLFDEQQRVRLGKRELTKTQLKAFNDQAKQVLRAKQKTMSQGSYDQLLNDFIDELDNGLYTQDEAIKMAQEKGVDVFQGPGKGTGLGDEFLQDGGRPVIDYDEGLGNFSKVEINPLVKQLYTPSAQDAARQARLSLHPEIGEAVLEMRSRMAGMVDEYKARGIPMEELNPFGQGWARRYVKHMVTDNFVRKMKEVGKAEGEMGEVMEMLGQSIGGVDNSALGRRYRGTILEANAKAAAEYDNMKIFVDDPLELFSARMHEMDKVIQDYDLFDAAAKYAIKGKRPGVGWVEYNPDEFRKVILDISKDDATKWKVFVPEVFRGSDKVYLPESVYDKLHFSINGWNDVGVSVPLAASLNMMDRVFRGNALYGLGYLGQNLGSNILTYLMHLDRGSARGLVDSIAMHMPFVRHKKTYSVIGENGQAVKLSYQQMLEEAVEDGVLKSSAVREMEFTDVANIVASNRQARQSDLTIKAKNLADLALGYRLVRGTAQVSDEIPKLAHYLSRRKVGFTRKGATEAAEQLYYHFGITSRSQDVVRKAIPFSSFGIKTTEAIVDQLRSGKLARLTIPGKVMPVFDGAYVADPETRRALDESLPWYKQWGMHPIHGALLPGYREMLLEVPWANATISNLFNPDMNLHPLLQVIGMGLTDKLETDDFGNMDNAFWWQAMQKVANLYLPPPVNNALAIAELTGQTGDALGGFFAGQYRPKISTNPEMNTKVGELEFNEVLAAKDFAKAVSDKMGENWLYDWFFGNPKFEDVEHEYKLGVGINDAAKGEFIRRKFRQLSLGIATMSKLDINYMMNRKAIERQIQKKEQKRVKQIQDWGLLVDTDNISQDDFYRKTGEPDSDLIEANALRQKLTALDQYYSFVNEAEREVRISGEFPGVETTDIFSFLFGYEDENYSKYNIPEARPVLEDLTFQDMLTPSKTKKVLRKHQDIIQDVNQEAPIEEAPQQQAPPPSGGSAPQGAPPSGGASPWESEFDEMYESGEY